MVGFIFIKKQIMKLKNLYLMGISIILFANCSVNKIEQKQLLARITATEDRLEILNLLAGSAISSDVASEAYWAKMFTKDAAFDRGPKQDKGLDEILKIINDPNQKEAIKAGMTHLPMLPHINLYGDSAVATGYLLIVMPDSAASHVKLAGKGVSPGFSIYQVTINRWQLVRTTDGWKVSQRTVRPLSSNDSRNLLERAIEGVR
jgi:SnoaL-like domain